MTARIENSGTGPAPLIRPDALPGVSVVVCCYNAAGLLAETLAHLRAQRVDGSLAWEVIVVDNASTDATVDVARSAWRGAAVPLRIVYEPRQGASYARALGLAQARFEFVSFVDADNRVGPDWIRTVAEVLSSQPAVAACGGRNAAQYESPPPEWFARYQAAFAVGAQGPAAGDVTHRRGYLWGAGLSLRRSAWIGLVQAGYSVTVPDRRGRRMSAGGDTELCHALRLVGWRLWYDPRLSLTHFMPSERLRDARWLAMCRGFGEAGVHRRVYEWALNGCDPATRPTWRGEVTAAVRVLAIALARRARARVAGRVSIDHAVAVHRALGRLREALRLTGRYERLFEQPCRLARGINLPDGARPGVSRCGRPAPPRRPMES